VLDYGEVISKLSGHMMEGNTSKAKFEYVHGALNEARLQLGTVHDTNNSLLKELEHERTCSKQNEDDFRRKEAKLQKDLAQKEEDIKKKSTKTKLTTLTKPSVKKMKKLARSLPVSKPANSSIKMHYQKIPLFGQIFQSLKPF